MNRPTYQRTVELPGGKRATLHVVGDAEGAEAAAAVDDLIAAARYERKIGRRLRDAVGIFRLVGPVAVAEARSWAAGMLVDPDLDEVDRHLVREILHALDEAGPDA